MKKTILTTVLALVATLALVAGGTQEIAVQGTPASTVTTTTAAPEAEVKKLGYADGTVLRMATGYNSKKTGLSFDADVAKDGIELAGVTYHAGDLKPTWVEVENILNIKIEDKYQGNSATNELKYWAERLGDVDIVSGNSTSLNDYGLSLIHI